MISWKKAVEIETNSKRTMARLQRSSKWEGIKTWGVVLLILGGACATAILLSEVWVFFFNGELR